MKITLSEDGDNVIFVSDLLNIHFDALERVFETVFSTIVNGIRLQHLNRDSIIDSDYIQFTFEHSDFVDYVFSGLSVQYSDFDYQTLVGGVMNWLSSLFQSDQQIDISKDWSTTLQISRMNELPRHLINTNEMLDCCLWLKQL